jgi:hypothetical protein
MDGNIVRLGSRRADEDMRNRLKADLVTMVKPVLADASAWLARTDDPDGDVIDSWLAIEGLLAALRLDLAYRRDDVEAPFSTVLRARTSGNDALRDGSNIIRFERSGAHRRQ